MSKSKELITLDKAQFPALADGGAVLERIRENLGGEEITPADLKRIKVPTGGATTWSVPTADGDESCKELEGVIIYTAKRRAYWEKTGVSEEPPDCQSDDCMIGKGNPGGSCLECPFNQWKSAINKDGSAGKGKRCKESRMFFLLREGQHLPSMFAAPPASLSNMKDYLLALSGEDTSYMEVLTQFCLVKHRNDAGEPYARVEAKKVGNLSPVTIKHVRDYGMQLKDVFESATAEEVVKSDDV